MTLWSYLKRNGIYIAIKAMIVLPITYHIGYIRGHMAQEIESKRNYIQRINDSKIAFEYNDQGYLIDTEKLRVEVKNNSRSLEEIFEEK